MINEASCLDDVLFFIRFFEWQRLDFYSTGNSILVSVSLTQAEKEERIFDIFVLLIFAIVVKSTSGEIALTQVLNKQHRSEIFK